MYKESIKMLIVEIIIKNNREIGKIETDETLDCFENELKSTWYEGKNCACTEIIELINNYEEN